MTMFRTLLVSAAVVAIAAPAFAADIYTGKQGSYKDTPVYEVPHSLAGFYVGVYGGWARSNTEATDIDDTEFSDDDGNPTRNMDANGAFFGGTLGYNFQRGNWVFGPEIEVGFINIDELEVVSEGGSEDGAISTEYGLYSVLGGRLGYAADRTLIYGKIGLAIADIKSRAGEFDGVGDEDNNGVDGFDGNEAGFGDETRYGLALGAGLEYAMTSNVSLKVEYLYMNFEDETYNGFEAGDNDSRYKFEDELHTVKFGVNYRFGSDYGAPLK